MDILVHITMSYVISIMSDIDVEQTILIVFNDTVNWNRVFNKIKPNLKDFYSVIYWIIALII